MDPKYTPDLEELLRNKQQNLFAKLPKEKRKLFSPSELISFQFGTICGFLFGMVVASAIWIMIILLI